MSTDHTGTVDITITDPDGTATSTIDAEFDTIGGDDGLFKLSYFSFVNPEPAGISQAILETIAENVKKDYNGSSAFKVFDQGEAIECIRKSIKLHLGLAHTMRLMREYQLGTLTKWPMGDTFLSQECIGAEVAEKD